MPHPIDIGEVMRRSGLPASTLHFYERHGLIESCGRSGLRRQYDPGTLDRLAVIALGQRAGFALDEIAQLLATHGGPERKALISAKLADVRRRMSALAEVERGLEHAVRCPSDDVMRCRHFRADLDAALPLRAADRIRRGGASDAPRGDERTRRADGG